MSRPNFSVTLQAMVEVRAACGEPIHQLAAPKLVTSATSSETSTGVTRRKPTGFIAPTSYSLEARRVDYQRGICEFYAGAGSKHVYGSYYTGVVGTPTSGGRFNGETHFNGACTEGSAKMDPGLTNKALIAVRRNLKSSSVNLGVAFGERNQTARLLGDTTSRIARSVRALRRGQIRNAMNELGISSKRNQPRGNNVPTKWLELQYGWKPLLSDVYGAASALENRSKGDWRVTARATCSQKEDFSNTITPTSYGGFGGGTCRAGIVKSVFARIDALPQNEATISLASMGVTNPLSVAWELVPYSFVVDWVIPIGGFLESLDAMLGYGENYYSSSFLVKGTWKDVGISASAGSWYNKNNYIGRKRLVYLVRTASANVPLPTLPRFKDPRSLGHMANGLALLASAFGRK